MSLGARITGLSPFGPIFGKELRIASRRKRNHFLRVAYLGGLLLFMLMIYVENSNFYYYGQSGVAARLQQQAQLGQYFFATFSMFCISCMGLIAPVLTSTAINSERLGKTLPVLLMTPITSWQIVSGKLFSRLLIALMLIGLSLPVLAVVRLLGGVETWQMFAVLCICISFALSCAAIGLFFSTVLTRAYAVILMSYATLISLYGLIPLFVALIIDAFRIRVGFPMFAFLGTVHPFFNTAFVAVPDMGRVTSGAFWYYGVFVQLGVTALLLIASALVLRRIARHGGEKPPVIMPAAVTMAEATPLRRAAGLTQDIGDNPVLWREMRKPLITGKYGKVGGAIIICLMLLSYILAGMERALDDNELQMVYGFIFNGLAMLLVGVLSATAIAQEKESDTWTLLLATPVTPGTVVMGKLMGVARKMFWPMVLVVVHFAIFAVFQVISFTAFFLIVWVILTFNIVWAATGAYLSLRLRKVTTAVIFNLMIPIVLFIAVPIVLAILGELFARNDDLGEIVLYYLPYFYIATAAERLPPGFSSYNTIYMPDPLNQTTSQAFIRMAVTVGFLHLLVAAFVIRRTISGFDNIVGRARQA